MSVGETSIQSMMFVHKETKIGPYYHDILQDAHLLTTFHLKAGIADIDSVFGKGYSKEHPELLSAYLHASSLHYNGRIWEEETHKTREAIQPIDTRLHMISDALAGISNALDGISNAISYKDTGVGA